MNRLISKLTDGVKGLVRSMKEYPLETAVGLAYFLVYVFKWPIGLALKGKGFPVDVSQFLVWLVPHIVLCFTLHRFKDRHKLLEVLYYLSWFAWIPLLLWCSRPYEWTLGICYLLAAVALLVGTRPMENVPLGRHILSVVLKLAEGLVVGMVLWGVIYVIVASVDTLFSLSLSDKWYNYPSFFNWLVIVPVLCCSLVGSASSFTKGEHLLEIIVDKILSPALVIYAAILYGYIVRILIQWRLPDGGVAYMVLLFLCVALACHLLRLQLEKRHYEWFYKAFPAIAVAPLVLLWIGIFRRIGEYGVTDTRWYLLVLSALVTLFVAMLVKERTRRFQLMLLIMAAAAVLFTFVPGIRSKDFGIRSQTARLEKLLPEVLEDGRFPVVDYRALAADSLRCRTVEECYGAWHYLKGQLDTVTFKERYGNYGDFDFRSWKLHDIKSDLVDTELEGLPVIWSLQDVAGDIDLGPYTQLVHDFIVREDSLGIAFCRFSDPEDTLLYCPVRARLDQAGEDTAPEELLVYENGRYKAVLSTVRDYGGLPEWRATNAHSVLVKKPE